MNPRKTLISLSAAVAVAAGAFTFRSTTNAEAPISADSPNNGKALSTVQDLSRAFRNVGKEVEPSVVNLKVKKIVEPPARTFRHGPMNDPFFRRFFDQNGDGIPDFPGSAPGGEPFGGGEQIGEGSGVIVDVSGNTAYIVTNNHVAGDADEITVVLHDGRILENGTLVGADAKTDLAVVKVEASNLKSAHWGNSDDLEKGDWVLAFGAPFGYVGSMTHGVVSATNRTNMGIIPQGYESFIQIDAPINPGNSGGPLTNIKGEIVGINTAIASRTGGFQGIGFAIPSNQAKAIYQTLRENGTVVRGWLGVKIASVGDEETAPLAKDLGYAGTRGVYVQDTYPNTPASGKLEVDDIITKINGRELSDSGQLRNTIAMLPPDTEVKLEVFRAGKTLTVPIKLGKQPANLASVGAAQPEEQSEERPGTADKPRLGIALEDLSPDALAQLNLPKTTKGALITRVVPGSPAAHAGLRPGLVISKIGNQTITSAESAIEAIRKQDLKKGMRLRVLTPDGGQTIFVQAHEVKPKKPQP